MRKGKYSTNGQR